MQRHTGGRKVDWLIMTLVCLASPGWGADGHLSKDMCDQITAKVGHVIKECQDLVDSTVVQPQVTPPDAPPPANPMVNPPAMPRDDSDGPPPGTPGAEHYQRRAHPRARPSSDPPSALPSVPPAPNWGGSLGNQSDCDNWSTAFDVIGSFTNWAFYMGDTERQTLHGIYIEDASQNSEDARDRAKASVSAADGCSDLTAPAVAVSQAYVLEFQLLTVALHICAMDKSGHWQKCPGAMDAALKQDDQNRKSGGVLDSYLAAVDNGHSQCLSSDDRRFFEEMRLTPCQRSSNAAPNGNRCASERYGILARVGQLRKVRAVLGKIDPASPIRLVSDQASIWAGQAHDDLTSLHNDCSQDNRMMFGATFKAWVAQKTLEQAMRVCPTN